MALSGSHSYPPAKRRLRAGMVGGGMGLVGQWHWTGVRLSNPVSYTHLTLPTNREV